MLRKLMYLWIALLVMVPITWSTAFGATLQNARWVTRNDAEIPYVRMVMDLSEPVKASASIDESGRLTTITLKNTDVGTVRKWWQMDPAIAGSAKIVQDGKNVTITIATPTSIDTKDISVFSLKKDTVNNKPYRIVIDVKKQAAKKATNTSLKDKMKQLQEKQKKDKQKADTKKNKSNDTKKATTPPVTTPTQPDRTVIHANTPYRTSGGLAGKVITIDPGHGGSDPGAIGPNGTMEKSLTIGIAKYLEAALKAKGAKVEMTRTTDVDVFAPNASGVDELQARVNVANQTNSDAFISIHINSFTNPSVGGIATYYYSKTPYDATLAQKIQDQIMDEPNFNGDRGIQEGNLYVLRHSDMPAVLVELGFISNPKEEQALNEDSTQKSFANKIVQGLINYFGGA